MVAEDVLLLPISAACFMFAAAGDDGFCLVQVSPVGLSAPSWHGLN